MDAPKLDVLRQANIAAGERANFEHRKSLDRDGFLLRQHGVAIQMIDNRRSGIWRINQSNLVLCAALMCRAVRYRFAVDKPDHYTADFKPGKLSNIERELNVSLGNLKVWFTLLGDPVRLATNRVLIHNEQFYVPFEERSQYNANHQNILAICSESCEIARKKLNATKGATHVELAAQATHQV